jgi:hypothetical protein
MVQQFDQSLRFFRLPHPSIGLVPTKSRLLGLHTLLALGVVAISVAVAVLSSGFFLFCVWLASTAWPPFSLDVPLTKTSVDQVRLSVLLTSFVGHSNVPSTQSSACVRGCCWKNI